MMGPLPDATVMHGPRDARDTLAPLRVGWCPGALRPMPVGDGLLVRVKPAGQRLSLPQARGLAELAGRHGNGALTITARGNLQIRGVAEAALPALTEGLTALGLLDRTAEGEAVRNVVSNPLAGLDPSGCCDLRAVVAALETALATREALWRLPAKFAWVVDEAGTLGLGDVAADVRFTATPETGVLAVALAGAGEIAACRADAVVEVALRLATAFLTLSAIHGLRPHRMHDLVAALGAPAVFAAAGLSAGGRRRAAPAAPVSAIGVHRHGARSLVGAGPAFGFLEATVFAAATDAAGAAGAPDIRLMPWRSLLAPGLREAAATRLAATLSDLGLIVDAADPRLAVAACVGAPACRRATTPVPADALALSALLPETARPGLRLHVSGCAKGCAHGGPAALTLVGRDGGYDVVRHGRADAAPSVAGLSREALVPMLRGLGEVL